MKASIASRKRRVDVQRLAHSDGRKLEVASVIGQTKVSSQAIRHAACSADVTLSPEVRAVSCGVQQRVLTQTDKIVTVRLVNYDVTRLASYGVTQLASCDVTRLTILDQQKFLQSVNA